MSEKELKPCPFCGKAAKLEVIDNEFYYVSCENCGSSTSFGKVFEDGTATDSTEAETKTAWNNRGVTMAEYIEREAFIHHLENCIDEIKNTNGYTGDFEICLKALKNQPATDVVRHGKWETIIDPDGNIEGWLHKECGRQVMSKDNFCPNCGAKMGKE